MLKLDIWKFHEMVSESDISESLLNIEENLLGFSIKYILQRVAKISAIIIIVNSRL